jgi:HPt (histidine-containing phosphotransfer) domain-containing protein
VLEELRAIDEDLLREVAGIFAADVPQQIVAVRAALAAGDAGAVERAAHRLKGIALGVGARALADAAAVLEHAGRAGDLGRAAPGAPGLDAAFEAARAALDRECR